jgi:hypothetical protein
MPHHYGLIQILAWYLSSYVIVLICRYWYGRRLGDNKILFMVDRKRWVDVCLSRI